MNVRPLQKIMSNAIYANPLQVYKQRCLPYRSYKNFCSKNSASEVQNQKSNETNLQQTNEHKDLFDYQDNFMNSFFERQNSFFSEFDNFHRQFFNQLPLRRYAHFDEFSQLDRIFNQEFNRVRNQFFEPYFEQNQQNKKSLEAQQNQKQETKAESKETTNETKTEQTVSQTQKAEQNKDAATKETPSEQAVARQDGFFDIDSFFSSSRYISDIHKIFEEEQNKIHRMMSDFETQFQKGMKENNPNVHQIRSFYKRTPEGEVREFYDSKNPSRNFKSERKFEQPSLTNSEGKTASTKTDAPQKIQASETTEGKSAEMSQKQDAVQQNTTTQANASTSQNASAQQNTASQTVTESQTQQNSGQIDISPELNSKAKKLSLMLNKEYLECLELARVYPTQSLGQIIDIIEGNEAKQN